MIFNRNAWSYAGGASLEPGLNVMSLPRKRSYIAGESFDPTGMRVLFVSGKTQETLAPVAPTYTLLEYIESNGAQYIDTGISDEFDVKVSAEFMVVNAANSAFIWSGGSATAYGNSFYASSGLGMSLYYNVGTTVKTVIVGNGYVVGQRYSVSASYGATGISYELDGVSGFGSASVDTPNTTTIKLFSQFNGTACMARARMYRCTMEKDGALVRDFVPCTRSDNQVGMYDLVHGVFYPSLGASAFIAGPALDTCFDDTSSGYCISPDVLQDGQREVAVCYYADSTLYRSVVNVDVSSAVFITSESAITGLTEYGATCTEIIAGPRVGSEPISMISSGACSANVVLQKLTVDSSIQSIASGAFASPDLSVIQFRHTADDILAIEDGAFSSVDADVLVIVPDTDNIHAAIAGYDWAGNGITPVFLRIGLNVTQPDKHDYIFSEALDTTGMSVWFVSPSGRISVLTAEDYVVAPTVLNSAEDIPTVTFMDNGVIYTEAVPVTAHEAIFVTDGLGTITGLTDYGKTLASIRVPEEQLGEPLTAIGRQALQRITAQSITLSDSIVSIGDYAFDYASLTQCVFGNGLTSIGMYAFRGCALAGDLALPDTIVSIGMGAFYNQSNLTGALVLPSGLTTLGGTAFSGCSKLSGVVTIPAGITSISSNTFYNCKKLTGVVLHNNIGYIGASAFENCAAMSCELTVPANCYEIGDKAFYGCSGLTGVLSIPRSVDTIGESCFGGCSGLTSLSFVYRGDTENLYITIEAYAFAGCTGLAGDVALPPQVNSVGTYVFNNCQQLESVRWPNNLRSIPSYAFQNCFALRAIYKSASMRASSFTSIGSYAFRNCYNLNQFVCGVTSSSSTSIHSTAFHIDAEYLTEGAPVVTYVAVQSGATQWSGYDWGACNRVGYVLPSVGLHAVDVDDDTYVAGESFDTSGVSLVYLSAFGKDCISFVSPEECTFSPSGALTQADTGITVTYQSGAQTYTDVIPITVTEAVFTTDGAGTITGLTAYGSSITGTLTVPAQIGDEVITDIGKEALMVGTVDTIRIEEGVQRIGDYAISGAISRIEFPASLVSTGVASVILTVDCDIVFANGCAVTFGSQTFQESAITKIELPASITSISGGCFDGCSQLVQVVAPGVTTIGDLAFVRCPALRSVTMASEGVTSNSIGENAFLLPDVVDSSGDLVPIAICGGGFAADGYDWAGDGRTRFAAADLFDAQYVSFVTSAYRDSYTSASLTLSVASSKYGAGATKFVVACRGSNIAIGRIIVGTAGQQILYQNSTTDFSYSGSQVQLTNNGAATTTQGAFLALLNIANIDSMIIDTVLASLTCYDSAGISYNTQGSSRAYTADVTVGCVVFGVNYSRFEISRVDSSGLVVACGSSGTATTMLTYGSASGTVSMTTYNSPITIHVVK